MYALGAIIAVCFFVITAFLIFQKIPESNEKLIYLLLGTLVGSFGTVVNYFYGSSKGSSDKTDLITKDKVEK